MIKKHISGVFAAQNWDWKFGDKV